MGTTIDECFVEPLFALKKNEQARNVNLRRTRDLLLPKLISGEIDVENLDINIGEIAAWAILSWNSKILK